MIKILIKGTTRSSLQGEHLENHYKIISIIFKIKNTLYQLSLNSFMCQALGWACANSMIKKWAL